MATEEQKQMSFKFVYIPADLSENIEEWELEYTKEKEVECLLDKLRRHFKKGPKKTAEQIKQKQEQAMKSLPAGVQVNEDMMKVLGSLQTVENISLLSNSPQFRFEGVTMYCDDEGSLKNLPTNQRASEITSCCGKPLTVLGDAFIARVMDDGDDFARMDFTIGEVSSSAQWVKDAYKQNEAKRKADKKDEFYADIRSGVKPSPSAGAGAALPPPPPLVRELSPAESAKEDGNAAFKKGLYEEALKCYSRALELVPSMLVALNNRAMVHLKLGSAAEAEQDCILVLESQPTNVKALLRRAAAREALGNLDGAIEDYQQVLSLESSNKEASAQLQRLVPKAS